MFIELFKFIQNNAHLNIKQKISNGVTHSHENQKLKNLKQQHNEIIRTYSQNKTKALKQLKNKLSGDIKRT